MKLKKIEIKNQSYSTPKIIERYELQSTTDNGEKWYTSIRGKSVDEIIEKFKDNEKWSSDMAWIMGKPDTSGVRYRIVHQTIHQIATGFDPKTLEVQN
ncbi:hypothetical protein EBZ80_07230 [bacterium]|nr:hypothetical protein [bacterium]